MPAAAAPRGDLAVFVRLLARMRPYAFRLGLALVTFVATGATVLALGRGVRTLVDQSLHDARHADLDGAALLLLLLVGVYAASTFGRAYLSEFLGDRLTEDLRKDAFVSLVHQGPGFYEREPVKALWSGLEADLGALRAMTGALIAAFRNLLITIGGAYAMAATSPRLTAAVFLLAAVATVAIVMLARSVRRLADAAQAASASLGAFALERLEGAKVVQAFSQEAASGASVAALTAELAGFTDRRNLRYGGAAAIAVALIFGSAVLVAWLGAGEIARGAASEGLISSYLFYTAVVAAAAAGLSEAWNQQQKGLGAAKRTFRLIDLPRAPASPAGGEGRPAASRGEVRFEGVGFAYPAAEAAPALTGLSFTAAAGRTTAIVGPSGAGKSTVLNLLLRFHDPASGRVLIDGADVRSLALADLRASIGWVPQDSPLLDGTILDNIRFGRPEATTAAVEHAADAANATEFIARLPLGLATPVGSRGAQLSGGQRQRIAIARALIRDPAVLLLDEATNALDAESEGLVQAALERLSSRRTTLVIAHKLATVRRADAILVIVGGRLSAQGTHDELMAGDETYARLARRQFL